MSRYLYIAQIKFSILEYLTQCPTGTTENILVIEVVVVNFLIAQKVKFQV